VLLGEVLNQVFCAIRVPQFCWICDRLCSLQTRNLKDSLALSDGMIGGGPAGSTPSWYRTGGGSVPPLGCFPVHPCLIAVLLGRPLEFKDYRRGDLQAPTPAGLPFAPSEVRRFQPAALCPAGDVQCAGLLRVASSRAPALDAGTRERATRSSPPYEYIVMIIGPRGSAPGRNRDPRKMGPRGLVQ